MTPRPAVLFFLAALLAASAGADQDPDPCEGRNPLHCRVGTGEVSGTSPEAPTTNENTDGEPTAVPDCEGRNPLYCGVPLTPREEGEVALMPPGGCEGRNPLYCLEERPKVEEVPEERPDRERANADSRNPNRNKKANPRANPNRRNRRAGDGNGGGGSGGS
jgi:hypothetical protein